MPRLGYAALIVFSAFWACIGWAATEATSFQCPGGEWVVNPGTPDCPTQVESARAGDLLTDTTTNVQSDLHQTGGTGYWCIYPAANADPDWDQLVAGNDGTDTACVDSGSGSASSTTFSGSATGLTAATDYKTAQGVLRNGKRSRISVSDSFLTLGGAAPGGGDLTNSGFFYSPTGNDSNNGLSPATAKLTLPSSLSTGANVYLETDGVWSQQWNISWNGTAGDLVEIDTYCIDTSDSNKPKAWTSGGTGCGEKAEIRGSAGACMDTDPITCDIGTYNGSQAGFSPVPSGIYAGLVDLGDGRQYVHLRNLKVHDSAGRGVDMRDAEYIVVEGLDVQRIAFEGIISERGSRYVIVKDNYLDRANAGEEAEDTGRLPGDWIVQGNMGAASQPSCIKLCVNNHLHGWDAYCGAWGNIVKNCAGEAFGFASSSRYWVEQNITYDTALSYYTDHAQYTYVLRNLAAGLGNQGQSNQSGHTTGAEGTAINRGEGQGSENELRAWNITVGTALGIGMRNIGTENNGVYDNWSLYYHNTVIRPQGLGVVLGASGGTPSITSEVDYRANAVWASSAANMCRKDNSIGTIDYQSWSGINPSDADCQGANDTTAALTWPHSATDYENITYEQAVSTWTLADYKPSGANENAAPVISVPAWATTDLSDDGWDWAKQHDGEGYFMWGAAGCTVEVAAASLMTGADCQGLDASPDIGAVQ